MTRRVPLAAVVIAIALVPAVRLAWLSRDVPALGRLHDDSLYYATAKALAQGSGYRIASLPGEPYQTKYPPVLPLLLSVAWRVNPAFPENLGFALGLVWAPLPLLLILWNSLMKRWGVDGTTRVVVTVLAALNPCLAYFGTTLMSEIWATVFVLAAFLFSARARGEPAGWAPAAMSGFVAAAAYLTKTMCAPLLAAVLVGLAGKRQRLWFLAGALPPVAAWHIWAAAHRAPALDLTWLYYLDYLGFLRVDVTPAVLPAMIYRNFGGLFVSGGDLLMFRLGYVAWGDRLAQLLMIAALAGVVRWTRASCKFEYPLFAAGSFALLLVWNFPPNERFLIPVCPLLILGLWTEMRHLAKTVWAAWRRPERSQRVAARCVAILLGSFGLCFAARNLEGSLGVLPRFAEENRRVTAELRRVYGWIRANVPPGAVFFADYDPLLYLHTGQHATAIRTPVRHFYTNDRTAILAEYARLPEFALDRRLDYLLLTPVDFEFFAFPEQQRRAAHDALARDPRFHTVYDSPAGRIVKVNRPSAAPRAGGNPAAAREPARR
jgi:hypothetical protein